MPIPMADTLAQQIQDIKKAQVQDGKKVGDIKKADVDEQPPPYDAGPSRLNEDRGPESSSSLEHKVPKPDGDDSENQNVAARPPLDYSSWGAFFASVLTRFKSLWTKRFVWSLLAGQVVSLCITCTNVTTTELVNRNWSLPTTQTFFL